MAKGKTNKIILIIIILAVIAAVLFILLTKKGVLPEDSFLAKKISITASDGKLLNAYLSKPAGDGPFPAVLLIHGGQASNQAAKKLGESIQSQTLKKNGYVTLSIDFRASEYGGKELDDAVDAFNYLKSLKYVNSNKIGIFGSSHGAYITLMTATKVGAQAKAIVDNFGPSDMIVMYEDVLVKEITCDDEVKKERLRTMADTYFGGAPENGNALWTQRSPIYNIQKFKAPVLIIHGKSDCKIPIKQSYKLRDSLRAAGKPVEMKVFENGPHGFIYTKTEEARNAGLAALNFFNKYLK